MSIVSRAITVACDTVGCWATYVHSVEVSGNHYELGYTVSYRAARYAAYGDGWAQVQYNDYCADCVEAGLVPNEILGGRPVLTMRSL